MYVYKYDWSGAVTIDNNQLSNINSHGIYVQTDRIDSPSQFSLSGNQVNGTSNNGYGIYWSESSSAFASVAVENNEVQNGERTGLYVSRSGSSTTGQPPQFTGNRIHNNGSDGSYNGISVTWNDDSQPLVFSRNELYNNTGSGLSVVSESPVYVVLNHVYNNGGDGVALNSTQVSHVHENRLENNGGVALNNVSSQAIAADNNWWGATLSAEMASGSNPKNISGIYDIYDNSGKGTVSYVPWLASSPALTDDAISWVRLPADSAALKGPNIQIEGSASAAAGIDRVEVSVDNGVTWEIATGTVNWSYDWSAPVDGTYQLRSRVVTLDSTLETPTVGNTLVIDSNSAIISTGIVSSDTVWSGSVSIAGDIHVPAGVTLTIEAGTNVGIPTHFDASHSGTNSNLTEITVDGNLLILGTEANPVILSTNIAPYNPGDWQGIKVTGGALDIQYAEIQYAKNGIECVADAADATCNISHVQIADSSLDGVRLQSLNGGSLTSEIN